MGVDVQGLQILKYTKDNFGDFKKTLTIGRQGMYITEYAVKAILGIQEYNKTDFCEELFKNHFGSTSVDSIDFSNYEKATIIANMGEPLPEDIGEFDTIFDGGCLEHIFNINQALYNVSRLCKVGGQIIHVLPTNNQCGHGFWQFSPELFFSLYSEKNGYRDTMVLVGDTSNGQFIYRLNPPSEGERHDIQHPNPLYVMVRTVLDRRDFSHKDVQQSDYAYIWSKTENE